MGSVLKLLLSFVLTIGLMPALAYAGQEAPSVDAESASEDISLAASSGYKVDWSVTGTCEWSIDKSGNLVVRPGGGRSEGELSVKSWPWLNYSHLIKTATFQEGVSTSDAIHMFYHCSNLTSVDLSGLDTSNVEEMYSMFEGCDSLKSLDMSCLDTSNVTDMDSMFSGCSSLKSLNLSSLDISSVEKMYNMFEDCSSLTSLDLSSLDTSSVKNMSGMFSGCSKLASLDLSSFNTSSVEYMNVMFGGCSSLASLDLSSFRTWKVKRMGGMFDGCSSLTSLDLSSFGTPNLTDMDSMFYGCNSLTSLDLSPLDTSDVESMDSMFYGCNSLTSLDLSPLDTSNVTSMAYMFKGCNKLASLDLSSFNTTSVEYMNSMFSDCSLTSIDLSSLDTSSVKEMNSMFEGCSSLTSLDLSSFDTSNGPSAEGMLSDCSSLTSITLGTKFSESMSHCGLYMPSGNGFTGKWVSSVDGVAYDVWEIPCNVAATYTAQWETPAAPEQELTVYRMYNPITSEHLFTTSESEYNSLTAHDWRQEGVSWSAPSTSRKGVYRVYNPGLGAMAKMSHHYASDYGEAADLVANHGWRWDNGGQPIFYSAEDDSGNALDDASEVYRLCNDGLSAHHFTLDSDEYITLMRDHGWNGEGVAFYAYE